MLNDTYIRQVRAALWGEPVVWPEEETEGLLRLHAMQGTGALVYPSVLADNSLSSYARVQMKSFCLHTMQTQAHMTIQLKTVWQALEKAGIRPVLMKGAGLAAYYPSPEQRQWGDIDLFVGKEQYHPACAAIREAFPKALKFDEELDHYKHYNIIADGSSITILSSHMMIVFAVPRSIAISCVKEKSPILILCYFNFSLFSSLGLVLLSASVHFCPIFGATFSPH